MSGSKTALCFVIAALCASGCGGDDPAPAAPAADGGAPPEAGSSGNALGFTPSNIDLDGMDLSNVGDIVIDKKGCAFDSMKLDVECGDPKKMAFKLVTPSGSGQIGVYVVKSLRVEPNGGITFKGTYAIAIVALDKMDILGTVDIGVGSKSASAGGFVAAGGKGGGPGGGADGSEKNGGGGGGYCGKGGDGAANGTAAVGAGGPSWGTPEIVPLVGGASGGSGVQKGGTGGGALQLVAKNSITIGTTGSVSAGGGRGGFGGVSSQPASGAGSGGAILIESAEVTNQGLIAANGAGGGAKGDDSENGHAQTTPAKGGTAGGSEKGGAGSAGDNKDGGNGLAASPPGGGGGGAGRIRINTRGPANGGQTSPSAATGCMTTGTVK